MKITSLYIDGYKNIKDTYLDFNKNSLIVVLAENNYGKTNLVEGIEKSFSLLRQQGTSVITYLKNDLMKFLTEANNFPHGDFTFCVEFVKSNGAIKNYKYKLQIKNNKTIEDGLIKLRFEVVNESLELKNNSNDYMQLFRLESDNNSSRVLLDNDGKYWIGRKTNQIDDEQNNFQLALHQIGNMGQVSFEQPEREVAIRLNNLFDEVREVLLDLTKMNLGLCLSSSSDVSAIERFKDNSFLRTLLNNLLLAGKFEILKEYFQQLFPYYELGIIDSNEVNQKAFQLIDKRRISYFEHFSNLSFGTKRIFYLLYQMCLNESPQTSVEELENGLHPTLFRSVVSSFAQLLCINNEDEQRLIITTHNPAIVDRFGDTLDAIYFGLSSALDNGEAKFRPLSEKGIKKIEEMIGESKENKDIGLYVFRYCLMEFNAETAEKEGWFNNKIAGGTNG